MVCLRNSVMVIVVMVVLTCSTAFAQSIESIAADYVIKEYSFDRTEKEIVFDKQAIHYNSSYAVLKSAAYYADGSSTDNAVADLVFVLCFKKQDQWHIVYDLSRSDMPSAEELNAMKKEFPSDFPKSLLPQFWQRLLK